MEFSIGSTLRIYHYIILPLFVYFSVCLPRLTAGKTYLSSVSIEKMITQIPHAGNIICTTKDTAEAASATTIRGSSSHASMTAATVPAAPAAVFPVLVTMAGKVMALSTKAERIFFLNAVKGMALIRYVTPAITAMYSITLPHLP